MLLKESVILAHVGDKNFERGREYVKRQAIVHPRSQGTTLKALCLGSLPEPYRLWVRLTNTIEAASCSCPIGSDGTCKHIAALLLLYRSSPEEFLEIEELDASLQRRSKEELIDLIKKAIQVDPRLEGLFEVVISKEEEPF